MKAKVMSTLSDLRGQLNFNIKPQEVVILSAKKNPIQRDYGEGEENIPDDDTSYYYQSENSSIFKNVPRKPLNPEELS
jgi:hypothetical protein